MATEIKPILDEERDCEDFNQHLSEMTDDFRDYIFSIIEFDLIGFQECLQ